MKLYKLNYKSRSSFIFLVSLLLLTLSLFCFCFGIFFILFFVLVFYFFSKGFCGSPLFKFHLRFVCSFLPPSVSFLLFCELISFQRGLFRRYLPINQARTALVASYLPLLKKGTLKLGRRYSSPFFFYCLLI